ncbi:hypothetical protein NNJEOMEG_01830 [Fundidesulfovibrio magnetotacticus]|uniref:Uncharacterized protein n=1 Tax=Fundidesulfovibrio magnetotacticus TaxID=2730080 RepID=A0A6V8LMU3_9BACT|nr:hypothetical protein [Fundidesulfovibrio magnetotacticus]GFK93992.1 hypothetical protein NNJEOMEG_01830 [Fundidesulfovibrio magnetotacticus]
MDPSLYLCLILGFFMLSLSARQSLATDAHCLRLSDVPVRVRLAMRRALPGFCVRKVRVTLREGAPAYWFTGSTPREADLALLVLDSGEASLLPGGWSRLIEDEGTAPPEAPWLRPGAARQPSPGLAGPACAWSVAPPGAAGRGAGRHSVLR